MKNKFTFFFSFQPEWLICVQVRLTYKILHSANIVHFSCFLLISYQTAIISLYAFSLKTKDQLDVTCSFYFNSYALNMFRTLIYPSSGACDYSVELPHWSCVLGSMCVGVSVWLGWRGIRVAGFSLQHGYQLLQ